MNRPTVALLSTLEAPMLGRLIQECVRQGVAIDALILDSKPRNPRDEKIWEERTAGRLPPVPLAELEAARIPAYFVKNHNAPATAELVRHLKLDLLVNAGTPRILKTEMLSAPSIGVLNCHPGLLPAFRGCTCVEWAIYLDEQVGNTVHLMSEGIDEGPILMTEGLTFTRDDRYPDVRVKVYEAANELLARALRRIQQERLGRDAFRAQEAGGRYFKVIEPEKMEAALAKLDAGRYAFQK
jgi:methionyl-tRNA formyltransferase